jgi:hypothetical protein
VRERERERAGGEILWKWAGGRADEIIHNLKIAHGRKKRGIYSFNTKPRDGDAQRKRIARHTNKTEKSTPRKLLRESEHIQIVRYIMCVCEPRGAAAEDSVWCGSPSRKKRRRLSLSRSLAPGPLSSALSSCCCLAAGGGGAAAASHVDGGGSFSTAAGAAGCVGGGGGGESGHFLGTQHSMSPPARTLYPSFGSFKTDGTDAPRTSYRF